MLNDPDDTSRHILPCKLEDSLALLAPIRGFKEQPRLVRCDGAMLVDDESEKCDRPGKRATQCERASPPRALPRPLGGKWEGPTTRPPPPTHSARSEPQGPGDVTEPIERLHRLRRQCVQRDRERVTRYSWRLERPFKTEWLNWRASPERGRVVTMGEAVCRECLRAEASLNTSRWQVSELANCRNTERAKSCQYPPWEWQPLKWKRTQKCACLAVRDKRDLSSHREPCCEASDPRCCCDAKSASPTSCCECGKHCLPITQLVTVEEPDTTRLEPNTGPILVQLYSRSEWSEYLSE